MSSNISRRQFIINGTTIALGTGIMFKTGFGNPFGPSSKSKVVEVFSDSVVSADRFVDPIVTRNMVHDGLAELTGMSETPLSKYVKPGETIGLKINCLGRPELYTHKEVIHAMIEELKDAGIEENNIIVWDRFWHHMTDCGFEMNESGTGVRYMATERRPEGEDLHDPEYVYDSTEDEEDKRSEDGTKTRFSKIFTEECDKIINLAILKDHGLAGVTLCLKNISYGICNNNRRFHGPERIGDYITDIYALPEIREKIVLNLIDGIEGCFENGPVPRNPEVLFSPGKIWLSEDPVALDTLGMKLIEEKREAEDYPSLFDIRPGSDHIGISAKAGLGTNDPDRIDLVELNIG
jgi:uncharacterized protein (DUF362 family)